MSLYTSVYTCEHVGARICLRACSCACIHACERAAVRAFAHALVDCCDSHVFRVFWSLIVIVIVNPTQRINFHFVVEVVVVVGRDE